MSRSAKIKALTPKQLHSLIAQKEAQMHEHAKNLRI